MGPQADNPERRDAKNWDGCTCSAPDDPRVIVPKRNPALGWTVNVGRPEGRRLIKATFITYAALAAAIAAAFMTATWLSH